MKKLICFMTAAVMAVMLFAGVAGAAEIPLDGSWPEETIKIGVEVFDTTDETTLGTLAYFDYLTNYYNVEFICSESIGSAEDELAFISSCAAAGCKAFISVYNVSRETEVKQVTDRGMYY